MGTKYPTESEFTQIFHFIHQYKPRIVAGHQNKYWASCEEGGTFVCSRGDDQIREILKSAYNQPGILNKPHRIDSLETFTWVLFCKLKQLNRLNLREYVCW